MTEDKSRKTQMDEAEEARSAEAEAADAQESEASANDIDSDAESDVDTEGKEAGSERKPEDDAKSAEEQESERYMRLMAEFQNFKRRSAKEKSDIHAYANEKVIGDILPVLDNFERALEAGQTSGSGEGANQDLEAFAKGMELIFTQLKTALEKAGLAEIQALGEEFNPTLHNAVMTEDSDEYEDGKISKVLQKGFKLNDKVIRPSMVAVVRK